MSEVSIFGSALYGDKWQSNIANMLSKNIGSVVHRSTVQSWHKRNNLPEWAKEILINAVQERYETIVQLRVALGIDTSLIKDKIENFLLINPLIHLDKNKVIFGRVVYGLDKYRNKLYDAEITVADENSCREEAGWISFSYVENKNTDLLSNPLRTNLNEKLIPKNAVHKEDLDYPRNHYFELLTGSLLSRN